MAQDWSDLPPEISAKLMACLRETNGEFEVADMEGLVKLVAEYGKEHPVLTSLLKIDYDAVVEHFKRTGEVLPGMRIIHTETREGDNVTKLEIFRGPIPPKS